MTVSTAYYVELWKKLIKYNVVGFTLVPIITHTHTHTHTHSKLKINFRDSFNDIINDGARK